MQGLTFSALRLFGVLTIMNCVLFAAQARADYTDLSLTHEKNIQSYVVNADGSFVDRITLSQIKLVQDN